MRASVVAGALVLGLCGSAVGTGGVTTVHTSAAASAAATDGSDVQAVAAAAVYEALCRLAGTHAASGAPTPDPATATALQAHAGHDHRRPDGAGTASRSAAPATHPPDHAPAHHAAPAPPPAAHGGAMVGDSHAAGHEGAACNPTPEQRAAAMKLVEDTRRAIARYASPDDALLHGYQPDPPPHAWWDRTFHYSNWNEWNDPAYLDPNKVESLVYGQSDRSGTVLLGVMYAMPKKGQKGPEIGGCLTKWHTHENSEWGQALHVWIVDMPGGPFAHQVDPEYVRTL